MPEFGAGVFVKGAEALVAGGRDKDHAAGNQTAAEIQRAEFLETQNIAIPRFDAERSSPFDIPGLQINGDQRSPRRRTAGNFMLRSILRNGNLKRRTRIPV